MALAVEAWWGATNGRTRVMPTASASITDAIAATSSASSASSGGRMPGSRDASRVLPQPGGPISSR